MDSPDSNYGNADKYLFSKIKIDDSNLHRIKGEDNPSYEAAKYSRIVMANVTAKNSIPCFDIILLGIGEDGHTASIFPNQMGLLTSEKIYDVSFHPVTMQRRITMTGKTINNAENIYFLVSGESKLKIVNDILEESEDAQNYPAYYVNPKNGTIFWVMDKEASYLL
jgi:6-phosphogluconolactonase